MMVHRVSSGAVLHHQPPTSYIFSYLHLTTTHPAVLETMELTLLPRSLPPTTGG
jgi:hypothetical protein